MRAVLSLLVACASQHAEMQPASPNLDAPAATRAPLDASVDATREIGARHILVRVGEFPNGTHHTLAEAHALIARARSRVEGGEDFAQVARESSEDPPTARRGGDLGSFARGSMVQSFDEAVFALPVGGYAVVETVYGVHLVQRTR